MSDLLTSVSEHLLAPGGVTIESLQSVLGDLAGPGIDAADLYFQGQISESWALEDGIVKEGSFNLDQGVGVRAQSGEKPDLPTATPSPWKHWVWLHVLRDRSRVPGKTAPFKPSPRKMSPSCMRRITRWRSSAAQKKSSCSSVSMLPPGRSTRVFNRSP
jgi:Predicted Zn-dependent proteases and their inactivated homologs